MADCPLDGIHRSGQLVSLGKIRKEVQSRRKEEKGKRRGRKGKKEMLVYFGRKMTAPECKIFTRLKVMYTRKSNEPAPSPLTTDPNYSLGGSIMMSRDIVVISIILGIDRASSEKSRK